ncbi:MAG: hypothetical protein J6L98_00655 [Bacteroidales bacterium]|nr:hypothetical protein [Bacteroidales bacterium]
MNRKTSLIILVTVVALQCCAMFYWASCKAYYYIDELFTFEYVQNINNHTDSIEYMDDSPLWKNEEWLRVGDWKTRYTIEEGESVFDRGAVFSARKFFFDRNYMWIINALETVFGGIATPDRICFVFNVVVWILFQFILFFFLAGGLGLDRRTALLAVMLWGFSPLVLGLSVFCRFYSWTLFLYLIVLVLHKRMWDGGSHKSNLLYELAAILAMYLAFKNSELIFVVGGSLVVFFTIGLVVRKRYMEALYYSAPFIGGGLLVVLTRSSLLKVVFHPALYAEKGAGAAARHADFLLNASWQEKVVSLLRPVKTFSDSVPGSLWLALLLVLMLLLLFIRVRRKASGLIGGYSWIILPTAVVFWLFCGLCGFDRIRYHSFLFLLVVILAAIVFDKLAKAHRTPRLVFKVALCLVLVCSASPFFKRDVQYVYEWLKPSLGRVSEYNGLDAVVSYDPVHNYNLYYSTSLLSSSSSIYPVSGLPTGGELPELPDSFLYWATYNWSPVEIADMIKARGYSMELLYDAGMALVYICEKE